MYKTGFALILTQKGEHQSKGKPITPATKQITMTSSIFIHYRCGNLWSFVVVMVLDIFILLCVDECFVCLFVYTPGTLWVRKRTLDPQWLEFQMVVSYRVGTEKLTQVLCQSSQCATEPSPLSRWPISWKPPSHLSRATESSFQTQSHLSWAADPSLQRPWAISLELPRHLSSPCACS